MQVDSQGLLFNLQRLTWGIVSRHLLVRDRHDRVLELLPEVGDGLVDQEDGYRHKQEIDEEEDDGEDVLEAGLAEMHRSTVV